MHALQDEALQAYGRTRTDRSTGEQAAMRKATSFRTSGRHIAICALRHARKSGTSLNQKADDAHPIRTTVATLQAKPTLVGNIERYICCITSLRGLAMRRTPQ